MINYDLLRAFSTEKQIAKAWKEYTTSVAQNYEEFVSQVNQLVNLIPINASDVFSDSENITDDLTVQAEKICIELGVIPNRTVFCVYGDQTYLDFVKTLIVKYYQQDEEQDIINDSTIPIISSTIGNFPLNQDLDTILTDINATFHSSVVEVAIASAYDQADSLPDRISVARDYISEKFTSGFIDASGYLTERMTMLKSGSLITDIIEQSVSDMGLEELSTNDSFTIADSNAYQYTGATPTSAYCWDSVGSAITSGVKVAATAVKGIFKGIASLGKRLFNKGKKYIKEIIVDPYDIAELEGDDICHTIQNYYSLGVSKIPWGIISDSEKKFFNHIHDGPYHMDFICGELLFLKAPGFDAKYNAIESLQTDSILGIWNKLCVDVSAGFTIDKLEDFDHINQLLSIINPAYIITYPSVDSNNILTFYRKAVKNLYFAESREIPVSNTIKDCVLAIAGYHYALDMYVCLKPKPVKWSLFKWFFSDVQAHSEYEWPNADMELCGIGNLDDLLMRVSRSDIQYCDVSSSEQELYNSFVLGFYMSIALLARCHISPRADVAFPEDYTISTYRNVNNSVKFSELGLDRLSRATLHAWGNEQNTTDKGFLRPKFGQSVSNSDFLNAATGVVGVKEYDYSGIDFSSNVFRSPFGDSVIDLMNEHLHEEVVNPLGYQFLPYDKDNAKFFDSKFRIKTDQENIDRFNNFITTTVILVVVALTATALVLKLRRAAMLSKLNLQAAERDVSTKLRNGTATKKDLKDLRKIQRKNNLLSKLTGNTTQAMSNTSHKTESESLNNDIISLITG